MDFKIAIEKDEDGWYIVTVPALPGCISQGKTEEEAKNMFWTSLKRTGAGYIDFYLLHNLGENRTKFFDDFGMWDYVRELKEKGLVRHIGFSIHDKADALDKILTEHPEMELREDGSTYEGHFYKGESQPGWSKPNQTGT